VLEHLGRDVEAVEKANVSSDPAGDTTPADTDLSYH
jgi:hypothetical protein